MKQIFAISLTIFMVTTVLGQTNTDKIVIVTKYSKIVPTGKKWVLEAGKITKVQINNGVLKSGTLCNAMFLSNPRMVFNLNRGDTYKVESYSIVFNNLEKVPYTNDVTYELTPIAFTDKNFSLSEFQNKKPEEVGVKKLIFKAGESVFVESCLESIEMVEVNMTSQELSVEKKNETKKEELVKANNFCIPINPEKYIEPGTKFLLKDSLLKYIVFKSSASVFRTATQKGGYDDVNKWLLTITTDNFKMVETSSGNVFRKFQVVSIKFEDYGGAFTQFGLADEMGKITHTLLLNYTPSSDRYVIILKSNDDKVTEEFQFLEVEVKEKG